MISDKPWTLWASVSRPVQEQVGGPSATRNRPPDQEGLGAHTPHSPGQPLQLSAGAPEAPLARSGANCRTSHVLLALVASSKKSCRTVWPSWGLSFSTRITGAKTGNALRTAAPQVRVLGGLEAPAQGPRQEQCWTDGDRHTAPDPRQHLPSPTGPEARNPVR